MKCPKCGEELMVEIKDYGTNTDKQDIDFVCENGHEYFARIREDDLMEI